MCARMHLHKKNQDLSKQNKMSNTSSEKKDLQKSTDINNSFTFNSKVSYKELLKSGLKRKREPENIVSTKKSKKTIMFESANHFMFKLVH